ncbi:hypothetical protein EI200_11825 [Peribacillus simplex]|uniref:hypothetical protein n=1 Tax=Peribacillus simplex TaxID=1478 RepID=UPI000F62D9FC|nr:hypothetical protein [Peribacillus simplex]RRN71137.1 hypothetical protein EI200_11825 [Peribacillus simplex]
MVITEPTSPFLFVEKLVVVGRNKNYVVPFDKGLNIVYGDFDTGKSSIVNLIDYLLGASELDTYDEIEINGKYALLQVNLNEKVYTIKRDLFDKNKFIDVYPSLIEEMEKVFPREYGPNYSKKGSDGYISDFLLQSLNIPLIKVKEAPTKDDSPTKRLSFRDIFKYCYLNQDDVGSKTILDNNNFSRYVKVKETFKFLHMVLDTQIADLEIELKDKVMQKNKKEESFNNVASFFRETKLGTEESLKDEIDKISKSLIQVEVNIERLTSSIKSDTKQFEEIRAIVRTYELQIVQKEKEKSSKKLSLEQKQRLKKDYQRDIRKLEVSLEISKNLPKDEVSNVDCPICERQMDLEKLKYKLGENPVSAITHEIKHLKGHIKSINLLIEEDISEISQTEQRIVVLKENLNNYKDFLDIETNKYISPYIVQRDALISQKATLLEQKKRIEHLMKLRMQLSELTAEANLLGQQIGEIRKNIETLEQKAPSVSGLLQDIADQLDDFLNFIPIKNPVNINMSTKSFLPIVRNRDYVKLTSGGLRTLVSVGFFVSLLKNSLVSPTYLPRFLMIDTVGKYIGKTDSTKSYDSRNSETNIEEDIKEDVGDLSKFHNLYQFFLNMEKKYGSHMQIILVDNDLPESLEQSLQQYVVKHFRRDGREGCDIGLIDDV